MCFDGGFLWVGVMIGCRLGIGWWMHFPHVDGDEAR